MSIGIVIIFFSWNGMDVEYNNLLYYIRHHGLKIIFSLFFIIMGIYSFVYIISDPFRKVKKATLYLKYIDDGKYTFIDAKEKNIYFSLLMVKSMNLILIIML